MSSPMPMETRGPSDSSPPASPRQGSGACGTTSTGAAENVVRNPACPRCDTPADGVRYVYGFDRQYGAELNCPNCGHTWPPMDERSPDIAALLAFKPHVPRLLGYGTGILRLVWGCYG